MDRSKVTCSIQVCWRKLGPHQEGILWPSHDVHWTPCWLGSYFSSSSLMLLLYTSRFLLSRFTNHFGACRKFSTFFSPPFSLLSKSVWVAFWRHYFLFLQSFSSKCCSSLPSYFGRILPALGTIFALPTHWVPLTVSLASHLFDNFSTLVWRGLATCWRRTSERTLRFGSLHALVLCFTRFHKVLGWSSCLALSNQQACVRPCCFIGRSRPLGTGFLKGSRCYSLICSFHHWDSFPTGSSLLARPGWLLF